MMAARPPARRMPAAGAAPAADAASVAPCLPPAIADRLAELLARDPSLEAAVRFRLPAARLETASDLLAEHLGADRPTGRAG